MMKPHERKFLGLAHTSIVIPLAKRPVCQYCEKPLKLETHFPDLWLGDGAPRYGATLDLPSDAKAWSKVDRDCLTIWCGKYQGWGTDENGLPLFCTYICGVRFAQATYRGGKRIVVRREGEPKRLIER